MKKIGSEDKRPPMLLWLLARITIISLPLALLLQMIATTLGMKEDGMTFCGCAVLAFLITQWYEDLDEEVTDYLRKKYP